MPQEHRAILPKRGGVYLEKLRGCLLGYVQQLWRRRIW
jgi:hypothetical protein